MKSSGEAFDTVAVEVAEDIAEADGTWKLNRLDTIARMDDPKLREANRYVLQYMVGNSKDYEPPRLCRRPQLVRSRVYDKQNDEQIFS